MPSLIFPKLQRSLLTLPFFMCETRVQETRPAGSGSAAGWLWYQQEGGREDCRAGAGVSRALAQNTQKQGSLGAETKWGCLLVPRPPSAEDTAVNTRAGALLSC